MAKLNKKQNHKIDPNFWFYGKPREAGYFWRLLNNEIMIIHFDGDHDYGYTFCGNDTPYSYKEIGKGAKFHGPIYVNDKIKKRN